MDTRGPSRVRAGAIYTRGVVPRTALLGLVACAAACSFDQGFDGTRYRCGDGERCPDGQSCVGGVCLPAALDAAVDGTTDGPDGAMPPASCGGIALLRDSFDGNGVGPYWLDFADTGATVTEAGGHLVVNLPASSTAYAGYRGRFYYDLRGSAITARVAQVGGANNILEVRNQFGNAAQLVYDGADVYAGIFNAPGAGTLAQRPWNPAETFWRIREDAGMIVWELSTDGQSWSELHRRAAPFAIEHVQGVLAAGDSGPAPSVTRFDDVNASAPAALYCPVDQLHDDFAVAPLQPQWEPYWDTGCSIDEVGGALTATYTLGTGNVFCGVTSLHLWDLGRGDGVTVDGAAFPSRQNFVGYVTAGAPGGSDRLEMTLDGTGFEFRVYVGGTAFATHPLTIDRAQHRYWRMRGAGATAIFETSLDRSAWTERWRVDVPFTLGGLELNIGFGHYGVSPGTPFTVALPGVNAD